MLTGLKKFLQEFRAFAMRGNVLDMAVGVVVGAAFKAIVDSLVNDIISPLIGLVFNADFSSVAIRTQVHSSVAACSSSSMPG